MNLSLPLSTWLCRKHGMVSFVGNMAVQLKVWQGLFCIQTVTSANTVTSWLLSLWPSLHCHDGCHPRELYAKITPPSLPLVVTCQVFWSQR